MALGHNELVPACPTNITYWSETLVPNITRTRSIHINELREAVNRELVRRRVGASTFTDDPIEADSDYVRKTHVDELRTACEDCKNAPDCVTDNSASNPSYHASWTDPTITAGITKIRTVHPEEMRDNVNAMETVCICDCNFCTCNCNCTCCDYSDCKSCTHGW